MTATLESVRPLRLVRRDGERPTIPVKSRWKGRRLTEIRELAPLSRNELAIRIGIAPANITRWEDDDVEPKATALLAIAEALHVAMDDLMAKPGTAIRFITPHDPKHVPVPPGRPAIKKTDAE